MFKSHPLPFSISLFLSSATAAFDLHTLLSLHPQAARTTFHVGLESPVCSAQQKVSEAVPGRDINQEIRAGRVPGGIRACPRSPDSPEQDPTLKSLAAALWQHSHIALSPLQSENSILSQHQACYDSEHCQQNGIFQSHSHLGTFLIPVSRVCLFTRLSPNRLRKKT